MWSIEALEEIREECMEDAFELYPELEDKLKKPWIDINHKTVRTIAQYYPDQVRISAYLLSDETPRKLLQNIIMRGIIRGQIQHKISLPAEVIEINFVHNFPDKYDFENIHSMLSESDCEVPERNQKRNGICRYAVRCPKCGQIIRFQRLCKTVTNPSDYVCSKCNVPLERLF